MESLTTLVDLLTRREFVVGVVAGLAGLGVLAMIPARRKESAADWGLVLAVAALFAIHLTVARRLALAVGVAALAGGGWAIGRSERAWRTVGWGAVIAGALLVALRGGLPDRFSLQAATAIAIVTCGACLRAWSLQLPHHLVGPMMAVTTFGIWATVPETEMARALLGAAIPMALGTMAPVSGRLLSSGGFAIAGVVVWASATGGVARPASIIGGWACLGLLLILPFCRPDATGLLERNPWIVLGAHTLVVFVASRVIGLWESTIPALVASMALAVVAYLVLGQFLRGGERVS